jgi:hypothetical protein
MNYLELAVQVLEEEQQLLWVDDIWLIAKEKGYDKKLEKIYTDQQDNVNALDVALYKSLDGGDKTFGLIPERGLYYLNSFKNLSQLAENALEPSTIKSYQEVVDNQKVKGFTPTWKGLDGMILFFVIPIGIPISIYATATALGSYSPTIALFLGSIGLIILSAFPVLLYIQFTNCSVHIYSNRIEFVRMLRPNNLIEAIAFSDILSVKAKGLGREEQISSDFKSIEIRYKKAEQEHTKRFRCHAYINPNPIFNPYRKRLLNHQSFVALRGFLKEIAAVHQIDYSEL